MNKRETPTNRGSHNADRVPQSMLSLLDKYQSDNALFFERIDCQKQIFRYITQLILVIV
jgi:hypothetical protein